MKKSFDIKSFLKKRPLSWSSISCFEYSPEEWFNRYILNIRTPKNSEMIFGKQVGERIAKDPKYLPFVPRHSVFEYPFNVVYAGIKMTGFGDSFCAVTNKKLLEFKTGVRAWDQKRADAHGQIDMYLLMHFITTKIKPEEVECALVWLPTQRKEDGDFKVNITFVDDIEKNFKIFKTKRTMLDILHFGARIKRVVQEMEDYVLQKSIASSKLEESKTVGSLDN